MNLNASMQAFKDLFRFPFRDPKWQNKLLIGSLLGLASLIIPILPALPLVGYLARLIRAGASNEDAERLPEWDNWEELFLDGLRLTGVMLILLLPGILIMSAGWGMYMGTVMAMPAMEGRGAEGVAVMAIMGMMFILFIAIAVSMLLMLAGGLLLPPAMAHVAVKRDFGAFFRFGEWWSILRANIGSFLVAWAVFSVLYSILAVITQFMYMTVVLCMFIPLVMIPVAVYAAWVMYRLIGQAYGEAAPAGTAPAVESTPVA